MILLLKRSLRKSWKIVSLFCSLESIDLKAKLSLPCLRLGSAITSTQVVLMDLSNLRNNLNRKVNFTWLEPNKKTNQLPDRLKLAIITGR